jgi:hypothetical protein
MHYTPLVVNKGGPTGCGPCVAMHMSNSHDVNEINMLTLYNMYTKRYSNMITNLTMTV